MYKVSSGFVPGKNPKNRFTTGFPRNGFENMLLLVLLKATSLFTHRFYISNPSKCTKKNIQKSDRGNILEV